MANPGFRETNLRAVVVPFDAHIWPNDLSHLAVESNLKFLSAVGGGCPHTYFVERLNTRTVRVADRLPGGQVDEQINTESLACIVHTGIGVIVEVEEDAKIVGQDIFI